MSTSLQNAFPFSISFNLHTIPVKYYQGRRGSTVGILGRHKRDTYGRFGASLVAQMVKKLPAVQETALIPGLVRFPGEGNGNPLQYPCLKNSMDRGAW